MATKKQTIPYRIWAIRILLWSFSGLGIFLSLIYLGLFGRLPQPSELRQIRQANSSELLSTDGRVLGRYYVENRVDIGFSEIPPFLVEALLATEDSRFFEHRGIDGRALLRVFVKSILLGDESAGGGSTLSQQLAKNLFPRRNYWLLSLPVNKFREMVIASRLERIYSKKELLNLYLNTVPFGGPIYGINVASQTYFGKKPAALRPDEAALLVGLLKGPSFYDPIAHPDRALQRRNTVLAQMVKYGYLQEAGAKKLKRKPLGLVYNPQGRSAGPAAHFREHIRPELERILAEIRKPGGGKYDLYTDGLRIHTTLDYYLQVFAEQAVREQMPRIQSQFHQDWKAAYPWGSEENLWDLARQSARFRQLEADGLSSREIIAHFTRRRPMLLFSWTGPIVARTITPLDSLRISLQTLQAALYSLDPDNGAIRAWVGGSHFGFNQYDHVLARRQTGSVFKPIVYSAALAEGLDPCTYYPNEQISYPEYQDWAPANADKVYGGFYSLGGALARSINTIAVQVLLAVGIEEVKQMAKALGIRSDLPSVPSIALGSAALSLEEVTRAFATLWGRGIRHEPHFLKRIETRDGRILFEAPKESGVQVLDPSIPDALVPMLEEAVNSGTGSALRTRFGLQLPLAGKTGTTQRYSDGWFIGGSPALVTGIWVGASLPAVHFRSAANGQGAATALPLFGAYYHRMANSPGLVKYLRGQFPGYQDSIQAVPDCPPFLETGGYSTPADAEMARHPDLFRAVYLAILQAEEDIHFAQGPEIPVELSRRYIFESDSAYLRRMFDRNLRIRETVPQD